MLVAIAGFLVGAVLAQAFNVLVLVPAALITATLAVAVAWATGGGLSAMLLAGALSIVTLQTGYGFGIVCRLLTARARIRAPQRAAADRQRA